MPMKTLLRTLASSDVSDSALHPGTTALLSSSVLCQCTLHESEPNICHKSLEHKYSPGAVRVRV